MQFTVRRFAQHNEIIGAVVVAYAVDVMDFLSRE
jgi:hypothetical protein